MCLLNVPSLPSVFFFNSHLSKSKQPLQASSEPLNTPLHPPPPHPGPSPCPRCCSLFPTPRPVWTCKQATSDHQLIVRLPGSPAGPELSGVSWPPGRPSKLPSLQWISLLKSHRCEGATRPRAPLFLRLQSHPGVSVIRAVLLFVSFSTGVLLVALPKIIFFQKI